MPTEATTTDGAAPTAIGPETTETVAEKQPGLFAGELPGSFEDAVAALAVRRAPDSWIAALLRVALGVFSPGSNRLVEAGRMQIDGFRGGQFEEKQERERRYGRVYSVKKQGNGFMVQLEFPRRVPRSRLKAELNIPDHMPDYEYDLRLENGCLVVNGRLGDASLRKLAAISPAFPPDFTARIELPAPVEGFKHRFVDKTLEVVLLRK